MCSTNGETPKRPDNGNKSYIDCVVIYHSHTDTTETVIWQLTGNDNE